MESESSSSSVDNNLRFDLYAMLVALGIAAFIAVCFWRLYKLTVSAAGHDMMPAATATVPSDAGLKAGRALQQQDVAALPVFIVRGAAADDGCAAGAAPSVECAVCLAEIGDGETAASCPGGRCGHRFHVAFMDRWFRLTPRACSAAPVAVKRQGAVETYKAGARTAQEQVVVVVQS